MTFRRGMAFAALSALALAPEAGATPTGIFRSSSGLGGVTVTATTIDFTPPTAPPLSTGSFVVGPGTLTVDAGVPPPAGSTGTILDLGPATVLPLANFMTFAANPNLVFSLTALGPGSGNADCDAVVAIGDSCSAFVGSPVILTLTPTGTAAVLPVRGIASDGVGQDSTYVGAFTTQITGQTPAQIQDTILANGSITSTWSAEFLLTPIPPTPGGNCSFTIGFWKNHPEDWPVLFLTLGGDVYTRQQLLEILDTPTRGDASLILARQLIAAKLNVANGANPAPVAAAILLADSLLTLPGVLPFDIDPSSTLGQQMVDVAATLDAFNNGTLPGSCHD